MTCAFFISPAGELLSVATSHIAVVIADPQRFGVTRAFIEARHAQHGEPLGLEGRARSEVLVRVLEAGWIRVREQPPKSPVRWHLQVSTLNDDHRARLAAFAREALREHGPIRAWPTDLVTVLDAEGDVLWRGPLAELGA